MNKELYDLAEQVILDYTAASKWKQIERLKWTSAEVQELIVKGIEKVNGDKTSTEPALHKHVVTNCPLCGGETTFLEPDKCMTADCPNCVF